MDQQYDVIIVGPARGIFAALELVKRPGLRVLMIEKGSDIQRPDLSHEGSGRAVRPMRALRILSGWGGAGAYSDGKLTLTAAFGGWLGEFLDGWDLERLIDHVDSVYRQYGAGSDIHGEDREAMERLGRGRSYDLELVPARIRHIGTDLCKES